MAYGLPELVILGVAVDLEQAQVGAKACRGHTRIRTHTTLIHESHMLGTSRAHLLNVRAHV